MFIVQVYREPQWCCWRDFKGCTEQYYTDCFICCLCLPVYLNLGTREGREDVGDGQAYCFLFLLCEWECTYIDDVTALNYLSQTDELFCVPFFLEVKTEKERNVKLDQREQKWLWGNKNCSETTFHIEVDEVLSEWRKSNKKKTRNQSLVTWMCFGPPPVDEGLQRAVPTHATCSTVLINISWQTQDIFSFPANTSSPSQWNFSRMTLELIKLWLAHIGTLNYHKLIFVEC